MKTQFALLSFFVTLISYAIAQPKIHFDSTTYNLGNIKANEIITRNFKFSNTGNEPLIINQLYCSDPAVASYPYVPIMPGKSDFIEWKYIAPPVGRFSKVVSVNSNAADFPEQEIIIKGNIVLQPAIDSTWYKIDAGNYKSKKKLLVNLKFKRRLVDSLWGYAYATYAKYNNGKVAIVNDFANEDSILVLYILSKSPDNKIILISEMQNYNDPPHSYCKHYFDREGRTFTYEEEEDAEGAVFIKTWYFNQGFNVIAVEDSIDDAGANIFRHDKLPLSTEPVNHINKTLSEYLESKRIGLK